MKRILFLSERHSPDAGGVAASAGRISKAIAGLGVEVDVVAWTRGLAAGQVEQLDGNPAVFRMGRFREWDTTMPHTLNLLDWMLSSRGPYDAVWGHYATLAGFLAVWFARLNGLRSMVSIRGNDLDRDVFPPGDFARLEWTLCNAAAVSAVTRELARKAAVLAGREDVAYLPNAVDSEVFTPGAPDAGLRQRLGIGDDEAVLGFAGELREKKGLAFLLEALRSVRARRPACLLLIGDVRPSETPRLAGAERVVMTGQLGSAQEVNAHLRLCDVYLQPSLWDGMPNALLEAMASGCGCVVSDAGGIPEIVRDGVDGVVVPRWELWRLGDAVCDWLDRDEEWRARIREAARARVVAEFSPAGERMALARFLSLDA